VLLDDEGGMVEGEQRPPTLCEAAKANGPAGAS